MRELAVQAANDTNTSKDRALIQLEIDQILAEIDRTARQTEIFGRTPLFDPLQEEVTNPPSTVNVAFLVDDSGSMVQEINNLRNSVASFKANLEAESDKVKFGLMGMGTGHDGQDAAEMLADIGSDQFDSQLAGLTAGTGGTMDTYASIMEAVDASTVAGTAEPDTFTFEDNAAKVMVVITDTAAKEANLNPPNATQADAASAVEGADVRTDVIGVPLFAGNFSSITTATEGQFHDIGTNGDGIEGALNVIAQQLTETTPKVLSDEPAIHSGIHADEEIPTDLPSDVRPETLGISTGNASGEVTTKEKANELLTDIDEALTTVLRYQSQAGALVNRLESAQTVQAVAAESTDRTVAQMEAADVSLESYELAKRRIRSEAANAALARAFTYQRNLSQNLIGLIGGNFSGVG